MRLMFIRDAAPLAGVAVRLGPELEPIQTDEEGRVLVELAPGRYDAAAQLDGRWQPVALEVAPNQSLLVVDVGATSPATGSYAKAGATGQLSKLVQGDLTNQLQDLGSRYQIERVLGRGGMGVVLRARDTLLERVVAIKTLNEELASNADAQQIFLTEARGLAALSHPHLVAIHDVTLIEGRAIIVFEFIDGTSLEDLLQQQGRLDEADLLRAAMQMARAFEYLHKKGFIHRDIKPANMLVQADGTLKIIDFGLARSLEDIVNKGTQMRGTPAYMAPEQLIGDPLTGATDIYQLGITLYELASGKLPFEGGNIMFAHVHATPTPLDQHNPTLSPALVALIHRCIAKAPADRPTAEQLTAELRAIYLSDQAAYDSQGIFALSMGGSTAEFDISQLSARSRTGAPHAARVEVITGSQHDPVAASKHGLKIIAALMLAIIGALSVIALIATQQEQPAPQPPLAAATPEQPSIAAQDPAPAKLAPAIKLSPSEQVEAAPIEPQDKPEPPETPEPVEQAATTAKVERIKKERVSPKKDDAKAEDKKIAASQPAEAEAEVKPVEKPPVEAKPTPVEQAPVKVEAKPVEEVKPKGVEPAVKQEPKEEKKVKKVKPPRVF